MTIKSVALLTSLMAALGGCETAGAQTDSAASAADVAQVTKRILAGDIHAAVEAGASGNKAYVEPLRRAVGNRRYEGYIDDSIVEQARVALAKLGQARELQEYWCGAIAESAQPPVGALGAIGGWFTVQAVVRILDGVGAREWERGLRKTRTDLNYFSPKFWALLILPDVVPNPPAAAPKFPAEIPALEKIWREWIAAHESDLRRLEPTGEGVDLSAEACKGGQPRKGRR